MDEAQYLEAVARYQRIKNGMSPDELAYEAKHGSSALTEVDQAKRRYQQSLSSRAQLIQAVAQPINDIDHGARVMARPLDQYLEQSKFDAIQKIRGNETLQQRYERESGGQPNAMQQYLNKPMMPQDSRSMLLGG